MTLMGSMRGGAPPGESEQGSPDGANQDEGVDDPPTPKPEIAQSESPAEKKSDEDKLAKSNAEGIRLDRMEKMIEVMGSQMSDMKSSLASAKNPEKGKNTSAYSPYQRSRSRSKERSSIHLSQFPAWQVASIWIEEILHTEQQERYTEDLSDDPDSSDIPQRRNVCVAIVNFLRARGVDTPQLKEPSSLYEIRSAWEVTRRERRGSKEGEEAHFYDQETCEGGDMLINYAHVLAEKTRKSNT